MAYFNTIVASFDVAESPGVPAVCVDSRDTEKRGKGRGLQPKPKAIPYKLAFPVLLLANTQSHNNKTDELQLHII